MLRLNRISRFVGIKIYFCRIAAVALLLSASPALSQVQYDTSQLGQRADLERNRILLQSAMRHKQRLDVNRNRASRAQAQVSACENRARFRREYGADNPEVRRLESLCAKAGC